jgi:NADH:ubiquinone oxidoreductase subunit 2 (subunit N)
VVENISSFKVFIIIAWQKINPLIIIIYSSLILTPVFIILTTIIGAIGAINQNNIKKLIVFSSISNMGWIILTSAITENLWVIYFGVYVIILISLLILASPLKNKRISIISLTEIRKSKKNTLVFSFLVAAGLPPFVRFFSKVLVIQFTINDKTLNIMMPVLLTGSMVATFYYLKTSFNTFIIKNASNKIFYEKKQRKMKINTIILISLSPWIPLVVLIN